jgi:hypothetical protein
MKRLLLSLLSLLSFSAFSQIAIDDVGDGWKSRVDSAITIIAQVSPEAKALLDSTTNRVEFWLGDRSSTRPEPGGKKGTILLAVDEIDLGIYNIAAVLVHESFHLHIHRIKFKMKPTDEEIAAYIWEMMFLKQIPNCPPWLIINAEYQIKLLSSENR